MSPARELRLKAALRAASVLLHALVARHADAEDLRHIFGEAVVRETAHMLERGARSDAIRAFEAAAGAWSVRSRVLPRQNAKASSRPALPRPARDRPATAEPP